MIWRTTVIGFGLVLASCGTSVTTTVPTLPPAELPTTTTTQPPISSSTTTTVASPEPTQPSTTTTTAPPPLESLTLELLAETRRPVFAAAMPGSPDLIVVEQAGILRTLTEAGLTDEPYLDITDRVGDFGIEQGLLGLAFHPDFATNGRLFVYYTDLGSNSRLVEFDASNGRPNPDSARELLFLAQPTDRHNAGMLIFGPDGYLWIGLGEGGAAADNAQSPDTLLGSILRIDVNGPEPYAVPPSNPFVNGGGAAEVWGFGLRNPWRFTVDPVDRLVYVADVGHSEWEEVTVVPIDNGEAPNFGWLPMEGTHCFLSGCNADDFVVPQLEYSHADGNCSITGGYVYRGTAIPELDGQYFYADWCGGWVRSFEFVDGAVTNEADWTDDLGTVGQVTSFGLDHDGELLITTWEGNIYRLVPLRSE